MEATRKQMNRGRETIRQRCLAEEKARRDAEQAALKATEEEVCQYRDSCFYNATIDVRPHPPSRGIGWGLQILNSAPGVGILLCMRQCMKVLFCVFFCTNMLCSSCVSYIGCMHPAVGIIPRVR